MSGQTRSIQWAVFVLVAVSLTGCGSRLTDEQARSLCTWVSMGGLSFAEARAEAEFGMSSSDADEAARSAIETHCPQHKGVTN
jgi:hypothetical protein